MKKLRHLVLTAVTSLVIANPAMAEDANHYKGEPANTLDQAVHHFSEYNTKLETTLAGELTPETMNDVHQLTYTLENALKKMDDELEQLAETLERVHKASEHSDPNTVRSAGKQYLETGRKIVK